MEELILNKAKELFFSYGLKSVSMDDLARMAGISKKTIYQSVSDKSALVQKVVEAFIQCHKEQLEKSSRQAQDAVEEVVLQATESYGVLAAVNYTFFYELEKFFPAVWKEVVTHRQQAVLPQIIQNLERGIREEVYRAELEIPFLATVRLQQIETALHPKAFFNQATDSRRLMKQLTGFYLHGITNTKGKKLIPKYLNDNHVQ